jgi:hydrogenase maturation protease
MLHHQAHHANGLPGVRVMEDSLESLNSPDMDIASETEAGRIRIIGIGNALRGDDAVGLMVVRRFRNLAPPDVDIAEHGGEGIDLFNLWNERDWVILVDAVCSGMSPGSIIRLDAIHEAVSAGAFRYSTHSCGIAESVELARVLNRLPRRLIIIGIEGKTFEMGNPLSPEANLAVDSAIKHLQAECAAIIQMDQGEVAAG